MKILSIRGKNLASLAKAFEVNMVQPPLDNAGLFVITGRTGTGKSTILDALCLALFDRIPRLISASKVNIGHLSDEAHLHERGDDVKAILHRGASSGYAEVDFIGIDKITYRAQWEVRRARNKTSGRLQSQTMQLTNLATGQKLGDNKKQVLQLIETALGLTFDQFRRSALLAQGEFAAFLKLNMNERASLLEKMTGTACYSQLSIAARERFNLEKQQFEQLQQQHQQTAPLTDEARLQLETEADVLTQETDQLNKTIQKVQQDLQWYQQLTQLEQTLSQAKQHWQQAEKNWQQTAKQREKIEIIETVQNLREHMTQYDHHQQQVQQLPKQLQQLEQTLNTQELALKTTQQHLDEHANIWRSAKQDWQDAQPLLKDAYTLDAQLVELKRKIDLQSKQDQALQQDEQQQQALVKQLLGQQQQHQQVLEQYQHYEPVILQWDVIKHDLLSYYQLEQTYQVSFQKIESLNERLETQQQVVNMIQQSIENKAQSLAVIQASHHSNELSTINAELEQQELQATQWEKYIQWQQQRQQAEQIQHNFELTCQYEAQRQSQLKTELEIIQNQLKEAMRARDLAVAVESEYTQGLRRQLLQGEPCPVCGSKEHPWLEKQPINHYLDQQKQRVNEVNQQENDCIQQLNDANNQYQFARDQIKKSQQQKEHIDQQWPLLLTQDIEWLQQQFEQNLINIAQLKKQQQHSFQQQKIIDEHNYQLQTLQNTYNTENKLLMTLTDEQRLKNNQLLETTVAKNLLFKQLSDILTLVETIDKIEALEDIVNQWHVNQKQLQQIEERYIVETQILLEMQQKRQQIQDLLIDNKQQYQQYQQKRQTIFSGQAAADISSKLASLEKNSHQRYEKTQQNWHQQREQIITIQQQYHRMQQDYTVSTTAFSETSAYLKQAFSQYDLSEAKVRSYLAYDQVWLKQQRQQSQIYRSAYDKALSAYDMSQQQLIKHQTQQPQQSQIVLQKNLDLLQQDQKKCQQQLILITAKLQQDDEKLKLNQAIIQQLQQQQQHLDIWSSMDDLIGSASGDKFRRFVQSLTLDTLLLHANRQLIDLTRRYYLQRVPGTHLDLQVIDRDMADEVRSVHSLSGGESFLVSLALALGLASLSSAQTQIESLFIDEGFGSLDQETLDIVIASLDALQAQGRQVAVISHIAALVERIGVQVLVKRVGQGRSVVLTRTSGGLDRRV